MPTRRAASRLLIVSSERQSATIYVCGGGNLIKTELESEGILLNLLFAEE